MSTLLVTGGAGFIGANFVLRQVAAHIAKNKTADHFEVLRMATASGRGGSIMPTRPRKMRPVARSGSRSSRVRSD